MKKRWKVYPHQPEVIEKMAGDVGVSHVVAQLLVTRGLLDVQQAKQFIDVKLTDLRDPSDLPDVPKAVEVVFKHLEAGNNICIYGDYDVDGMTASSILYRCLKLLGGSVTYYVPHRMDEGYGLNHDAMKTLVKDGTHLVITVDCGIASIEEVQTAKEVGLDIIITDHHSMRDELPAADAIVHPKLPGTNYPFSGLCGAGVAFKLAWALCQRYSNSDKVEPRLKKFLLHALPLAALGTVADVVPLIDENRIIVKHGLNCLKEYPITGLASLMKAAKIDDKPAFESEDFGFSLGPRLNAAGRFGQARLGVELMTTDSQERADEISLYLNELNETRQSIDRSIYLSAKKQIEENFNEDDPAFVLAKHGWHAGVIGIVAGRIKDKYYRPVVLVALDELSQKPAPGSGRSISGYNIQQAFAECSEHLATHGGHAAAAGLTVTEKNLEAFREAFCEHAANEIKDEQLIPELFIDGEAPLTAFTIGTMNQLDSLAPFGESNRRPVWCTSGVEIDGEPKRMGGGGRHLSVKLKQHEVSMRAVAFGQGDWADELAELSGPFEIAFKPVINTFRGRRSVELHLVDWRESQ